MMRILVTGSSGLIGRKLVAVLLAEGLQVVRYDLSTGQDICDPVQMTQALAGCDGVIHLAAVSRVAWGETDPSLCRHVNVTGTAVLLQALLAQPKAPWIVFASSREVYGDPAALPVAETATCKTGQSSVLKNAEASAAAWLAEKLCKVSTTSGGAVPRLCASSAACTAGSRSD